MARSDGVGIPFDEDLGTPTSGSGEVDPEGLSGGETEGVGVGVGEADGVGDTAGELEGDGSLWAPASAEFPARSTMNSTTPTTNSCLDLTIASGTPRPVRPALGQVKHPIRGATPRTAVRLP